MDNTKENRLKVYKAALEYGKQTELAGLCWWIENAIRTLDMEFMLTFYHNKEQYPELNAYNPGKKTFLGCGVWFPYSTEGYEIRYKILETIISEMELELNTKNKQ